MAELTEHSGESASGVSVEGDSRRAASEMDDSDLGQRRCGVVCRRTDGRGLPHRDGARDVPPAAVPTPALGQTIAYRPGEGGGEGGHVGPAQPRPTHPPTVPYQSHFPQKQS